MKSHRMLSRPLAAALLGLLVARAPAQEEPAGESDGEARDPFAVSEGMERVVEEERTGFSPDESPDAVPPLVLRGYAEGADGNVVALLEVDGAATYLVREGDTVTLPRRGRNLVLRVVRIADLALEVEVGELRRVVVVR